MADPQAPTPDDVDRLRRALEAERAGAEHWRDVARRREAALAELKGRTSVRVLLGVERRLAPARAGVRRGVDGVRRRASGVAVAAGALSTASQSRSRARALDVAVAAIDRSAAPPPDPRSVLVIVHGSAPPSHRTTAPADTSESSRVEVVEHLGAASTVIETATEDVVVLLAATCEPLTTDWLPRLVRAVRPDAAGASAVLVHPHRPPGRATAHDLLVRSAGLAVTLDRAGCPTVVADRAGTAPSAPGPETAVHPIPLLPAGAVALARDHLAEAGGLRPAATDDLALVDLSLRLRATGAELTCAADVLALDHRSVVHRDDLAGPLRPSEPGWDTLLADHGPALRRLAPGADDGPLLAVITVASPSAKVADRWGDWHLAEGLARALRRHGHDVRVQTLADVERPVSRVADLHLVLRGLARVPRVAGQCHALWIISHPEDLDDAELDAADLLFVASEPFADALRARTATPVVVLLQATDPERFRPQPADAAHRHDVTVVGKSRDVLRPMVRDAVAAGLRPAIYGSGWDGLVDPDLVVTDHVANEDLPGVYASAGVVLNDHWDTMRRWGFVSNRVFDVLACGTPLVTDEMPEVTAIFGDLVPTWRTPDELRTVVRGLLDEPDEARARAAAARAVVVADHSFDRRAEVVLAALAALDPPIRGVEGAPAPS